MSDYRLGFETLTNEIYEPSLPVDGEFPHWLSGTLVRNGPAQFEVDDQSYNHWFDGHAMLHAFSISEGSVSYRNRFLQSNSRTEALDQGEIARAEFATDPCRTLFGRVMSIFTAEPTDNASINVAQLDDDYVALTETPIPIAFDPETLETVGVVEYDDDVGGAITTAHPLVEPETGRTLTYVTDFGRRSRYRICTIDAGRTVRRIVSTITVDAPSYMHSFGMTEHYVILAEWPLVVNPLNLLLRGTPFIENFDWMPDRGTRFRIVRKQDGREVARCEADPAFAFHHVNAFERSGEIVCDAVTYPDASIIDALYLDNIRSDQPTPATGHLRRYHLPLTGGTVSSSVLSDERLELPRIHEGEGRMQPYDSVYGIGTRTEGNFADQLIKIGVPDGDADVWHEDGTYPGEPVFVADPTGSSKDDGVILSVVLDPDADRSFLLVLDAASFEERARAPVPHAIPFGFHGQFFE